MNTEQERMKTDGRTIKFAKGKTPNITDIEIIGVFGVENGYLVDAFDPDTYPFIAVRLLDGDKLVGSICTDGKDWMRISGAHRTKSGTTMTSEFRQIRSVHNYILNEGDMNMILELFTEHVIGGKYVNSV